MYSIKKPQDLQERLKKFTLDFLNFTKTLPNTPENKIYGYQGIRSSSSMGANYAEAIHAQTRQDFIHVVNICRKETNETLYWTDLLCAANPIFIHKGKQLLNECQQLLKIFISSVKTAKANQS